MLRTVAFLVLTGLPANADEWVVRMWQLGEWCGADDAAKKGACIGYVRGWLDHQGCVNKQDVAETLIDAARTHYQIYGRDDTDAAPMLSMTVKMGGLCL